MTWVEVVDEVVRALTWFGVGFAVRAVLSSPFGVGWWHGGEGE